MLGRKNTLNHTRKLDEIVSKSANAIPRRDTWGAKFSSWLPYVGYLFFPSAFTSRCSPEILTGYVAHVVQTVPLLYFALFFYGLAATTFIWLSIR